MAGVAAGTEGALQDPGRQRGPQGAGCARRSGRPKPASPQVNDGHDSLVFPFKSPSVRTRDVFPSRPWLGIRVRLSGEAH